MVKITRDELYEEFLKNFPNFEPQVKRYFRKSDNTLKVYTKQGGKILFEISKDGIKLSAI